MLPADVVFLGWLQAINFTCSGQCFAAPPPPAPPPPPWVAPRLSVYYITTPVLPNETLMLAGAGLDGVDAKLCTDERCVTPLSAPLEVTSWNKSVKVVMPPSGCGPPCFVQLKERSGNMATVAVNRPDVWWVTTGSPGRPAASNSFHRTLGQIKATVAAGDAVRVFGRSLGWVSTANTNREQQYGATQLVCASGRVAPSTTQTKLKLVDVAPASTASVTSAAVAGATVVLASSGSTCYESSFNTHGVAPGVYNAVSNQS